MNKLLTYFETNFRSLSKSNGFQRMDWNEHRTDDDLRCF